jgi:SAM-dependent methyltransferase
MIREFIWMIRHVGGAFSLRKRLLSWRRDILAWWRFWQDYRTYSRLAFPEARPVARDLYPCLGEDTAETLIEPTYFYQDSWAFEKIVANHPQQHVDVGSHHKFVALLSKVIPTTMVDIRPLSLPLDSLTFNRGSILELPFSDRSIESLSSMCVIEHIGLGRYGDPLDPKGSEKAIVEVKRVIKPGGNLYLSLPLDDENRVYFNAHRAFTEEYILSLFEDFILEESRYIYGREFVAKRESGFGTGCYHLRRIK